MYDPWTADIQTVRKQHLQGLQTLTGGPTLADSRPLAWCVSVTALKETSQFDGCIHEFCGDGFIQHISVIHSGQATS